MENYTAYYSCTGTAGKTDWDSKQYSFFGRDNVEARRIAEEFAWKSIEPLRTTLRLGP